MSTANDRPDPGLARADVERMIGAVTPGWTVERVRPAAEGSASVVFVTAGTPEGTREVVVKAFTEGIVPDHVARSEPRVLDLVAAETAIPVPEVVGFVDDAPGLPTPYFVADRLPNRSGAGRFRDLSADALERVLAAAGRNLAALHDARSFDRFGRVGVEDGELAVVEGSYGRRERWTDWLLADAEDTLDGIAGGPFDDLVEPLRGAVRDRLAAVDGPESGSFVHWDYRLGNLLVDPATGETTGVLDWADLLAGDPVYNLVAVEDHNVNWQTRDVVLRRRLRDRLLGAYESRRRGGRPDDFRERKRAYHLCHRLNAMACFPDWYDDADPAVRDEREADHRAFVREYL